MSRIPTDTTTGLYPTGPENTDAEKATAALHFQEADIAYVDLALGRIVLWRHGEMAASFSVNRVWVTSSPPARMS